MAKPITVHTLAAHLGISAAAVSTVLANRHEERRLSKATVLRVHQAVRELGYVPNIAARRLRAHERGVKQWELGILTSFEAPLFLVSRLLRRVQQAVDARSSPDCRYSVTIDMFHAGRLKEMPGLMSASRFNGVIVTNTLPADDEFLRSTSLPYAVVVQGRRLANHCCVLETPRSVGTTAAQHLHAQGCKYPVILVPSLLTETTADRAEAFAIAFAALSGRVASQVEADGFGPAEGAGAFSEHIRRRPCDGVFAVTDTLALGAYCAIQASGRSVGKDVRVIGVGDDQHSEFLAPSLTCVGPDYEEIVEKIVALLLEVMERRRARPVERLVVPRLIERASA